MKRKPVLVISSTRSKDKKSTLLFKSLQSLSDSNTIVKQQFKLNMHVDNTSPLPLVYNKYITPEILEKHDIVLFVHDDVYIDDLGCFDKMYRAIFECGNDIVGLAGSSQAIIKKPALWHLMSSGEHHSGAVGHFAHDNTIRTAAFGLYPKRCLLLDGLFLGVNLKTVLSAGWQFNENFSFHHYDLSSCLDANKLKLKLSTYNINVIHASPGLQDYHSDQKFRSSEEKFLQLYAD